MAIFSRGASAPINVVVVSESAAADPQKMRAIRGETAEFTAAADSKTEDGKSVYPDPISFLWAAAAIVAGAVLGTLLYDADTGIGKFVPPKGVGIFALFYLVAQVIERVQEPFTPFLGRAKETTSSEAAQGKNQIEARAELERALVAARKSPTPDRATNVANKQRTADQISANLTVLMFGTGAFLAMLLLGYLKAGLLDTLGVNDVKASVEVLASGLIVGAGTKPLHDLISKLTTSKQKDKQAEETKP